MNRSDLWRRKIIQFLHDPPGKPYARYYRAGAEDKKKGKKGGHVGLARRLAEALEIPEESVSTRPDLIASGADRTFFCSFHDAHVIWGGRGQDPIITHPLAAAPVKIEGGKGEPKKVFECPKHSFEPQEAAIRSIGENLRRIQAEDGDPGFQLDWNDELSLQRTFLLLWRRLRDEIIGLSVEERGRGGEIRRGNFPTSLLWQRMPADTRQPDHTIWDHARLVSAFAFLEGKRDREVPDECRPWLVSFSLGPVQAFIAESRTSRDLWTNSMLLADLSWHAMKPFIDTYGPDAILYPELNGNPMVDRWMAAGPDGFRELLGGEECPQTWSALLPHHWVGVVPQGESAASGTRGPGLPPFQDVLRACEEAVADRWRSLQEKVFHAIEEKVQRAGRHIDWFDRWNRQHSGVIHTYWVSQRWGYTPHLDAYRAGGALPAQRLDDKQVPSLNWSDAAKEALENREKALRPWVPDDIWGRYEWIRRCFAATSGNVFKSERGFDYALNHHRLGVFHDMRKGARTYPSEEEGGAERCTLCHNRAALETTDLPQGLDSRRAALRQFWERMGTILNQPNWGEERLCAVCTMRRLLVQTGRPEDDPSDFNFIWAGRNPKSYRHRNGLHVPFPSTSAIAAQRFVRDIVSNPEFASLRRAVAKGFASVGFPRTFFPQSLASLADYDDKADEYFLQYDPQLLFKGARQAELRRLDRDASPEGKALEQAINTLMKAAAERKATPLSSRIALVALDGDGLSRLLLGDPEQIGARYRDVLHPSVPEQILDKQKWVEAGWKNLLALPRLTGPSLQAFISRSLADFADRIVPWVVEKEFHGRLIYAGGDDVLAMVDADDALPMAARLQQIYSSPWVVDTTPHLSPWEQRGAMRTPNGKKEAGRGDEVDSSHIWDPDRDGRRFVIPECSDEYIDLSKTHVVPPVNAQWGISDRPVDQETHSVHELQGELLAMPGPYQSLSAGIVYAHFKTGLGHLVQRAHTLLDEHAKERCGRSAFAMALMSRGGEKCRFGARWYREGLNEAAKAPWPSQPTMAETVMRTIKRFQEGSIPGRLPYKLREMGPALELVEQQTTDESEKVEVGRGLLMKALDGPLLPKNPDGNRAIVDDLHTLWRLTPDAQALMVCRGLATSDEEDEGW